MPNVVVTLSKYWKDFCDELVKTGVYASRSELIRAALIHWYDAVFYKSRGLQELAEDRTQ